MHTHRQSHTRSNRGTIWLLPHADALGMAASVACMIHCLAMPVLLVVLPAWSSRFVHDDMTHYFLAAFVTAFCLMGILPGYLKHSRKSVLAMMVVGLSLVLFATFAAALLIGERFEAPIITIGNLLVVAAHYLNRKLLCCAHAH